MEKFDVECENMTVGKLSVNILFLPPLKKGEKRDQNIPSDFGLQLAFTDKTLFNSIEPGKIYRISIEEI
jgi:hypothetical protein